jgi:hypothetical protein
MADSKLMTLKEALVVQAEIERLNKADDERRRIAQYYEQRQAYETTVTCKHREQHEYIEVGEFDFNVCPDCMRMIVRALTLHDEIKRNRTATR